MTPVESLLAKLSGVKKTGKGWSAKCPSHDDRRASLSISEGDDGRALVKCHAGCTVEAVSEAAGLRVADLMPATDMHFRKSKPNSRTFTTASKTVAALEKQHGKRSAMWTYHNAQGVPVGVVIRWDKSDGKDIRPVSLHSNGWMIGAMPDPRPLYGLPDLVNDSRVLVVEGEKAVDAARSIGFTATTSAGGAGAASKTDWRPLVGKEVWILPDNDDPGWKYAETVAAILANLGTSVKILYLPGLREKGDIADWIDAHSDAAEPDGMRAEIEDLAGAVEPEGLTCDMDAFKPFPVKALPEPLHGFVVAGAKAIGCDPSYLALPLLTSLAAAIGNTRRLELKRGWSAPPIIWCALVGESGTAKTPAFKLVMKPVQERQRKALARHTEALKKFQANLACWEKDFATWKRKNLSGAPPEKPEPPLCERFVVSDITVEALSPILLANWRGLLLARDELNGWIGSFDKYSGKGKGNTDSANWLSMFSGECMIVDRKTPFPQTIFIPLAAVCVCGGIQPGILNRALRDEHRESGLAARLLLTCPPRKVKQWTEADIDSKLETALANLVDRLFELRPTMSDENEARPMLVRMTPDAKWAWTAYFNAHAKEQVDLTGDLSAAWSKLEEYAARLALVIHYARWAAGDVADELQLDLASIQAGITLATWFKGEARRVYAMLSETDGEGDVRRLVDWIGGKGGSVTVREVQQGCRWLKSSGLAESALNELIKTGRGSWRESPTSPMGGRPGRLFVLNNSPSVYETHENKAAEGVL